MLYTILHHVAMERHLFEQFELCHSLPARLFDLGWRIDFLHAPETSETGSQGVLREFGIYYKQPKEIQKRSDLLTTSYHYFSILVF